jgi:hypothetical protein
MKTYEVVFQIKTVITANSKERATTEVSQILWNADRGIADFIIFEVEQKSIQLSEMAEM